MSQERRNLIISPIGPGSVHASWLSNRPARTFDVFLINYSETPDLGRADADHYLARPGFKWELLEHVVREQRALLMRYDRIWLPDCDIKADTETINRLFTLFSEQKLEMAQPAIAAGEVSFQTVRRRPGVVLRYTPYVETMCPLFTRAALFMVSSTFLNSRSGWGIDLLWPRFFQPKQIAILDQVGVEHTGQLMRGEHYQKLAKLGIHPMVEFDAIVKKFGGFNRRLHRKLVRGQVKLPAIWEPDAPRNRVVQWLESRGWLRSVA